MTVRVRFAPSPTGFLHLGNARTALYNYLFARRHGGSFMLRSDDTDTARNDPSYQADILNNMRWLGLSWDEGIEAGGPHATYRQSERLGRYRQVTEDLVSAGLAYRCFCSAEELDGRRKEAMADGRAPGYDGRCRTIDQAQASQRVLDGTQASVRLAIIRPGETVFDDVVRGEVRFDNAHIDDFVMLRSSGMPTYHLASSVDDVDFGITHVIRGEDLLSSTPKHIAITLALGEEPITYAHLPLIQGADGRKLSKRHGETSVTAYREAGYLPEALVNYLALLGWSPGDDETVVGLDEMVERFDLGAVSKNAAIFDVAKLDWMNGVYVRELDAADFVGRTQPLVEADLGRSLDEAEQAAFVAIAPLVQERAKLLTEVAQQVRFLFVDEVEYDETSWQKVMTSEEADIALAGAIEALADVEVWTTEAVEAALRAMLANHDLSARKGLQPVRVALTGSSVSPPLFESITELGRPRALARLERAVERT